MASSHSTGRQQDDLFVTLAAASGIADTGEQLRESHNVHIDGVNNLEHRTGTAPSERTVEPYYNESQMTAIRIGNWKSHFMTREGFFDYDRPSSLIFNLRMDLFERHEGSKPNEIAKKPGVAWGGRVQDALGAWFKSLQELSPRRKGPSLKPGGQN